MSIGLVNFVQLNRLSHVALHSQVVGALTGSVERIEVYSVLQRRHIYAFRRLQPDKVNSGVYNGLLVPSVHV